MLSSLDKSPLKLDLYKQEFYESFKKIIGNNNGRKTLVFTKEISDMISLLVSNEQLCKLNINYFHYLEEDMIFATDIIIFLIQGEYDLCSKVIKLVKDKKYIVIFVPNVSLQCLRMFERAGVYDKVAISSLYVSFVPMEYDLLSMENKMFMRLINNEKDNTPLFDTVKSIIDLQKKFGVIPFVQGIGTQSQFIMEEMLKVVPNISKVPQIGRMIILDRSVDFVTPLLTQLVYSGMIDDIFGIESNIVIMGNMVKLNSDDKVYEVIRDETVDVVETFLANEIVAYNEEYKKVRSKDTTVINEGIKNIKMKNSYFKEASLKLHFNIKEKLKLMFNEEKRKRMLEIEQNMLIGEYVDQKILLDTIKEECPIYGVIRLICLFCFVNNGIDIKLCEKLNKEIIIHYGAQHPFLFDNLFSSGLLFEKDDNNIEWKEIRKRLHLFVDGNNDISYVFGGYAPISCRLVEFALTVSLNEMIKERKKNVLLNGWRNNDVNKRLRNITNEPIFHLVQDAELTGVNLSNVTLIFFVGGVTYSEIAALRYLERMNPDKHIMIATTKVFNGNEFIKSIY